MTTDVANETEITQAATNTETQPASEGTTDIGADLLKALEPSAEEATEDSGTASTDEVASTSLGPEWEAAERERIRTELEAESQGKEAETSAQEAARAAAEAEESESNTARERFDAYANGLRSGLSQIEGIDDSTVNEVLDFFTRYNGELGALRAKTQWDAAFHNLSQLLPEKDRPAFLAKRKALMASDDRWKALGTDLLERLSVKGQEGFVSAADATKGKADALKAQATRLVQDFQNGGNELNRLASLLGLNGARDHTGGQPPAGGVPTFAQWNAMTPDSRHELIQKDPQIEAKIMQAGR